jgi:hypothetical protein
MCGCVPSHMVMHVEGWGSAMTTADIRAESWVCAGTAGRPCEAASAADHTLLSVALD